MALININIEIILTIKFVKLVILFLTVALHQFSSGIIRGCLLQGHFGVGTKKTPCQSDVNQRGGTFRD